MKETLSQSLVQKMQQRLSPQQIRFVRLLEMTGPEVEDEVRRELDDNPALEAVDNTPATTDEGYRESAEEMQRADYRDEEEMPQFQPSWGAISERRFEPVAAADTPSLAEYLLEQLSETDISDSDLKIARYIIGNIDDSGYLTRTPAKILDDLAFNAGIEIPMEHLKQILARVRALDPPGVCAYDLRDCLELQLRRRPESPARTHALEIVVHYFDLFSLKHYDKLQTSLGIDRRQLQQAIDTIRSLNPKPGAGVGESEAEARSRHIIPDFNIDTDGEVLTLTLPNSIPDLQIEQSFRAGGELEKSLEKEASGRQAETFIAKKRDEAQEFIDILRMRQDTLYRVMTAIMAIQHDFFVTEDETRLRPMRLKDVGARTGLDLSVISRATAGKYVATPAGIYPLKYFFNEGVGDEEETSTREVLAEIREIISAEDKRHPLSDDAIMKQLAERGYNIARRTVAKYREREGILVARLRKEV